MNYSMSVSRTLNTDDTQRITISMNDAPSSISTTATKEYIKTWITNILNACSTGHTTGSKSYDAFISSYSAGTYNNGSKADLQLIVKANIANEAKTVICDVRNATPSALPTAITGVIHSIFTSSTTIADIDIISITATLHD